MLYFTTLDTEFFSVFSAFFAVKNSPLRLRVSAGKSNSLGALITDY